MNSQLLALGLIPLLIIVLLSLFIAVLYLLNLQDTLKEVDPSRRKVPPSNVWLMFIPLFNLIYGFILYPQICDSVKAEFEARNHPQSGDYGRNLGITMPILGLVGVVPVLGSLAGIANLVIFIIFWVKMAGYKEQLRKLPAGETGIRLDSSNDLLDN